MKKLEFAVILGLLIATTFNCVNAIEMNAYASGWNTTSYPYTMNGSEVFFTNNTDFINRIFFYYDSGMLKITVHAPDLVGGPYNIPILSHRTWNTGNETEQNYTTSDVYLDTLVLYVDAQPEPIINETNETEEQCEVFISVVGRAFYGKNLLIHTTDQNGKDIVANVVGQDGAGNSLICQTNNPFKGWCNIFIPEDSEVDITLLANKEGCTTGQYIINKLEGQRLTEEIEETEKTLIIQNIPSEVTQNTIVNFTIITQEEGEVVSSALVTITDPEDVQITTRSDNLGMAKFYAGKLGTYTLSVSKDGYITSQEYTVTSRVPRKELIIVLLLNGQVVRELYVGNTYEIGLYSDGTRINETLNGNINGEPITFENGYARYTAVSYTHLTLPTKA